MGRTDNSPKRSPGFRRRVERKPANPPAFKELPARLSRKQALGRAESVRGQRPRRGAFGRQRPSRHGAGSANGAGPELCLRPRQPRAERCQSLWRRGMSRPSVRPNTRLPVSWNRRRPPPAWNCARIRWGVRPAGAWVRLPAGHARSPRKPVLPNPVPKMSVSRLGESGRAAPDPEAPRGKRGAGRAPKARSEPAGSRLQGPGSRFHGMASRMRQMRRLPDRPAGSPIRWNSARSARLRTDPDPARRKFRRSGGRRPAIGRRRGQRTPAGAASGQSGRCRTEPTRRPAAAPLRRARQSPAATRQATTMAEPIISKASGRKARSSERRWTA